jgi:DNA-binding winged helix-turn-helix (wHTH) protein
LPQSGASNLPYHFEDFALDGDRRELRRGNDLISVEPQVFDLLQYLIRNCERVVSKDDVVNAVWQGRIVSDATLASRVNAARSALQDRGEEQRLIRTILRRGFRFVGTVREEAAGEAAAPVEQPKPVPSIPARPSIAVLPFVNMSGDPDQDYLPTAWSRTSSPACRA